jgi:hypothetical protein
VKTTSGATAVQVVWSSRRGSREIEHMGSAHDEAELEALKAAAQQRIAAGHLKGAPDEWYSRDLKGPVILAAGQQSGRVEEICPVWRW